MIETRTGMSRQVTSSGSPRGHSRDAKGGTPRSIVSHSIWALRLGIPLSATTIVVAAVLPGSIRHKYYSSASSIFLCSIISPIRENQMARLDTSALMHCVLTRSMFLFWRRLYYFQLHSRSIEGPDRHAAKMSHGK